jgi:hypothetical protein
MTRMAPHQPSAPAEVQSSWTTRERILAELLSHGVTVPDLDPSTRFVGVARLTADYRPLARAFHNLEAALRWLQQTESEHAVVDVIVDLSAPSLETAVIRPFHVLTADNAREPLDLSGPALAPAVPLTGARLAAHGGPPRRRHGAPRPVD